MQDNQNIERLDYGRPPPGYEVGNLEDHRGRLIVVSRHRGESWQWNDADDVAPDSCGDTESESAALAAAWSHYKERHDPPGLATDASIGHGVAWVIVPKDEVYLEWFGCFPSARAATWAWHDRRLALADRVERVDGHVRPELAAKYWSLYGVTLPLWPRALAWSDDDVAAVERWLVDDAAEQPQVLRG